MTTPIVTPARGPVATTGDPVNGQFYFVPDDLFVIATGYRASDDHARIDHPVRGSMHVPCHALREVRYV